MKNRHAEIGEADDEVTALDLMDKAIRRHPTSHVRIQIVAERIPPRSRHGRHLAPSHL
jgi:hypothetical protein